MDTGKDSLELFEIGGNFRYWEKVVKNILSSKTFSRKEKTDNAFNDMTKYIYNYIRKKRSVPSAVMDSFHVAVNNIPNSLEIQYHSNPQVDLYVRVLGNEIMYIPLQSKQISNNWPQLWQSMMKSRSSTSTS